MKGVVYQDILHRKEKGQKLFAVLVDPDKYDEDALLDLVRISEESRVHYFFVGGSLMVSDRFEKVIQILKGVSKIPVVIFPGSNMQISSKADAILLLSLISGRNPEYLIGQHVVGAPYLKKSGLEILPTGYILVQGKNTTTANYMSNTLPIPSDKSDIAECTAMAGEMLGMKCIYMDGGSGAGKTIDPQMITSVKNQIDIPLIVGGGITEASDAVELWNAGADLVVVGNAIENDLFLIQKISNEIPSLA